MPALHHALRQVLLESPASLEALPQETACRLARVLEASSLEPMLYERLLARDGTGALSPARIVAWRTSRLLAEARATAYLEALGEAHELARGRGIPLRLLPAAQLAFHVYPAPELRPLASLEVQVPPHRAREMQGALKSRRFFEAEDLVEVDHASQPHLRPLERDGVVVKVYRRSTLQLEKAPWDEVPAAPEGSAGPLLLDPEPLVLCTACAMAARGFSHSLLLLHDLHVAAAALVPDWARVLRLAVDADVACEAFIALDLLESMLGPAVEPRVLRDLEEAAAARLRRVGLLRKLARRTLLEYPARPRHAHLAARLLEDSRARRPALAASVRFA
ncbi:MAG: nucleotidyltransferase family protein [Planctomycetes bacterium]|nr:nucleotidyltransferase family protein [Planctomycetota bacterium]